MSEITERDAAHWALDMMLDEATINFSFLSRRTNKRVSASGDISHFDERGVMIGFHELFWVDVIEHNEAAIRKWKEERE